MNLRDLVYIPLAIATAPLWARKARSGWGERFGKTARLPDPPAGKRRILIHAVSVGEVSALRGLVPRLAQEAEVVLSVTTDTGTARAKALFPGTTVVRYPLDFSWSVRRFLEAVRPDAVALVELELWPNFVDACRARGVPVCVINGRLSERSFKGYRRLRGALKATFGSLEFAAVQDEAYAARVEAMGVDPLRCLVTGSMKWDSVVAVEQGRVRGQASDRGEGGSEREAADRAGDAASPDGALAEDIASSLGIDQSRPLIVAGSTGPGEEALLDTACRRAFPAGVQLLCAPRKPERFDEAAAALGGCVRRSAVKQSATGGGPKKSSSDGHARFLLDTIGELRAAYTLADVVVMGRSFGRLFGSDPIEPASLGKATVIGPRVGDFESVVRALESAGGLVRATPDDLHEVLRRLIDQPGERERLALNALRCIEAQRGATARHAALLLGLLDGRSRVDADAATPGASGARATGAACEPGRPRPGFEAPAPTHGHRP
ncbi:MAG: glycosyltransferase N-terminal domain-containing protein [Phycisphaerales bacterium]